MLEGPKKTGIVHLQDLPDNITVSMIPQIATKIVKDAVLKAGSRTKLALIMKEKLKDHQFVRLKRLEKGKLIPLGFLRRLLKFLNYSVVSLEKSIECMSVAPRGGLIVSPKLPFDFKSKEGLRCIAAILGDGTHTRQLGYSKKIATSEMELYETKMRVIKSMESVLGEIRGWKEWSVKIRQHSFAFPKVVQEIINCFIPRGDKTETNPSVPDFVFSCDHESIGVFLSQFFDDEANVDEKRKLITLKLCVNNVHCDRIIHKLLEWKQISQREKKTLRRYAPQLLLDIIKLLRILNIRCKSPYFRGFTNNRGEISSACWQIYITFKQNIDSFYRRVNFSLMYKKEKLREIIRNYKQKRFSREELVKEYLRGVFVVQVEKGFVTPKDLSESIVRSYSRCFHVLSQFEKKGFVRKVKARHFLGEGGKGKLAGSVSTGYVLTDKGRKKLTVVLTGGTFDIIHIGHLATLNEAKRLGDVLVVVIARNETVQKLKGREPINSEKTRLYLVNSLKPVDLAILGDKEDPYKVVNYIEPDIIALGYDQKHNEEAIRDKIRQMKLNTKVVRLVTKVPDVKTSNILLEIQRSNYDINYI
jgi:cytidyltransferase-like protein